MDELVALVSEKTGLNKEQSQMAVTTVLDFVKKKLPAPVAAQLDAVLDNEGTMGTAANMLGGLFGGNK